MGDIASITKALETTAATAAAHKHLSLEERAQLANMVKGDLYRAAEVLSVIAGLVSGMADQDYAVTQDLRSQIMNAQSAVRKVAHRP